MTSTAEIRNGICFVTLSGEFDRSNAIQLMGDIETCLNQASSVVFDFRAVTFANGAIMCLLHDILEIVGPVGRVAVVGAIPDIERLFQVASLTGQPNFHVFATMEEAMS